MRDKLHWRKQHPQTRVIIGVPIDHYIRARAIWIEEDIGMFFKGGVNPFENEDGDIRDTPRLGMGIVSDPFDPHYVRPWVDHNTYQELGYYRK